MLIGIDPGGSGGIAMLFDSGKLIVEPMPDTLRDMWATIGEPGDVYCDPNESRFAIIENVHSMPGQGVASTFSFGRNLGCLEMALTAADIPYDKVAPRSWQKALGIQPRPKEMPMTEWKNLLKGHAQRLYPSEKVTLKTADALLLLEYARRTVNR